MVLLSGCFEINEEIDIKPQGNGEFSIHTDMSKLIEAMQSYLGKDEMTKQMPEKNLDTTIMMRTLMDTAKDISAENKMLIKDGSIHMKLNMEEKVFNSDIRIPFTSLSNLQKLYNSMNNQSLGFTQLFKGIAGKTDSSSSGNDNSMPDMNQFNAIYDFESRDGFLSRKLNHEKWKKLQLSAQYAQMKDAGNMGITIPYTLTVKLPRPVKKMDNPMAKFFPDRKTIILQYNLIEVFEHPEKFEYTIEY